jgi:GTP-binding protein HflX
MDREERGKHLEVSGKEESSAFLVGVYSGTDQKEICKEHLDELESLAETFGVSCAAKLPCPTRKIEAATFLNKGKLQEIADEIHRLHTDLLIIDEEISPAQQRNLEKLLRVAVMDRTELILEIFAQRAQTKEARLQVELARTKYQFPRLKRLWGHFSRQRARGGYLKGEGEKQLEIDRRLLKKKLERLSEELEEVKRYRQTQSRARRNAAIPTFAIIGYTNAGKSTLLNALTDSDVFVEDKLFATLDPTTRKFSLPNKQEILLTDTVGFIRKLPHTLVAAFRSTLESALHDNVLLHLIDVSHPLAEEQAETTIQLLQELGGDQTPMITVLNKVDRCRDQKMIARMRIRFPKTVVISALERRGFEELMQMMMEELSTMRVIRRLRIPQSEYAFVALIKREGRILYEEYEENYIVIRAEIPLNLTHKFDLFQDDTISHR